MKVVFPLVSCALGFFSSSHIVLIIKVFVVCFEINNFKVGGMFTPFMHWE